MRLKELLNSKHINQETLSREIQVSQKTISNYINGGTEPTMSVLIKIANYFDVSLDFLCERQFNNNVGYIPEDKKDTIKKLLELDNDSFNRTDAYITALIDIKK